MRTIINNYIRKLKMEKSFRLRLLSVVLCLALVVSVGVFWKLRLTGVSMTSDVVCNIEEHVHGDSCYEQTVICGLEESSEEGGHAHAEACFEKQLACGIEEHAHSIDCISDEEADVEVASDWEASLPGKYTGEWATDVLSVAKSQLGYTESVKNFAVDEADNSRKGYTRYGAWYGNLYGDWNTMFMAFCLNYAGVPEEAVPTGSSCYSWISELSNAGLYKEATDYVAKVGDIVFFDTDEDKEADKVGIVSEVTATELISVEGDYENTVAYVTYNTENNEETGIVGVLDLNDAYLAYSEVAEGEELVKAEDAENEAVATDAPLDDASEEAVAEENTEENADVEATTEAPAEENMDGDTATELPSTDNNDANDSEKEESNEVVETDESVSEAEKAEETEAQDKEEEKEGTNAEEITAEEESDETIFDKFLATFNLVQYFSDEIVASGTWSNGTWELDGNGVLTISGSGAMSSSDYNNWYSNRSKIKKVVVSEGVTSLGYYAFRSCTALTEVELPTSLTEIGERAFYGCSALTTLKIPENVTTIGGYAFYNCSALTTLEIPENVTSISAYTFYGCTALTSLEIPENLTTLGAHAFSKCSALTKIKIPEGVTAINNYTFNECTSLIEIEIPDSVTTISNQAFYKCTALTQIAIPNSVTSIGSQAFLYCSSLSEITIPESITTLSSGLFSGCTSLSKVTIPNTVTSIDSYTFQNCTSLTAIEIPDSVTSIKGYAFSGCSGLTEVEIPESVTTLPNYVFSNCTSLTTVYISDSLSSINSATFSGCNSLTDIIISDNNENFCTIDDVVFNKDKTKLVLYPPGKTDEKYIVPESVITIGANAFYSSQLKEIEFNEGLTTIENSAFYGSKSLVSIEFPETLKTIGSSAFYSCEALVDVKLPDGITSLGSSTFSWCKSLTSISIPEGVTTISREAFYRCSSLSEVVLPSGLIKINDGVFKYCESLNNIVLPEGLTSIGSNAFEYCTSLTSIKIPSTIKVLSANVFAYCAALNTVELPDTLTTIGTNAFYECTSLNSIELLESLTTIGNYAFYKCSSLQSITIPASVTSFGNYAFSDCKALDELVLKEGLSVIGTCAFRYCSALKSLVIPESITSIPANAFESCTSMNQLILPKTLVGIGKSAFQSCISLNEIKLPEGLVSIEQQAFYNCDSLTAIEIPKTVVTISQRAFDDCHSLKRFIYNASSATTLQYQIYVIGDYNLIVGTDVDVLPVSFATFMTKLKYVPEFVGPNIIDIEEGALANSVVSAPLYDLSGEVYVDESGALYRLDHENLTASLLYCPSTATEFVVPESLDVAQKEATGIYKVTGVESYAFAMANDLKTITFENSENIEKLADYAFADAEKLSSINGEERMYDINLSFTKASLGIGLYNNTNLIGGKLVDYFKYENPTGVQSAVESEGENASISINVASSVTGSWKEGENGFCYDMLTGDMFTANVVVNPGGTQESFEYRIYIERTNTDCVSQIKPGDTITFDGVEVVCYETEVPQVNYLLVKLTQGETAQVPISLYYPNVRSDGGGARIWAEIVPADEATEGEYISPNEAVEVWWNTKPDNFKLSKSYNLSNYNHYQPLLKGDGNGGVKFTFQGTDAWDHLTYTINLSLNNDDSYIDNYGDDHVLYVDVKDTFDLPDGIKWSEDVINNIKNGNYNVVWSPTRNNEYVYFNVAGKKIAQFFTYYSSKKSRTNMDLSVDDEGNITFSYRLWNEDPTSEFSIGSTSAYIYYDSFEVEIDKFNATEDHRIINTVTTDLQYSYSGVKTLTAEKEVEVIKASGTVSFEKSLSKSPSYYGDAVTYNLSIKNNDINSYQFIKDEADENSCMLTDSLNKWMYITGSQMQTMLNNEKGKSLVISIADATLCNDSEKMTEVTAADGGVAYITGENSNLDYEIHDLVIKWQGDDIVVIVDDTDVYTVESSLEETLDELGFIMISEDTVYSLSWDVSAYNDGIIYGGDTRSYTINATVKDTFRHGTGDDPGDYKVASYNAPNYAYCYSNEKKMSASRWWYTYSWQGSAKHEAFIDKSLNVNGEVYSGTNSALSHGDILDYTIGFSGVNDDYTYENLPIVDELSGVQKLLVPVAENTKLSDSGLVVHSIDGMDYYELSKIGTYEDVYIGVDENENLLIANEIKVTEDSSTIKWYFTKFSGKFTKNISYKALIDASNEAPGEAYLISNIAWANDREGNRIYATIPGITVRAFGADKEIYDIDNNISIGDYCMIGEGETVTYRLSLESISLNGYVLNGLNIWDELPYTYDAFKWERDVNVKLWFDESVTGVEAINFDDWYIEKDSETNEYIIRWPETSSFNFETANMAYIYVQLTFPDGDYWVPYTAAANGVSIYNTLHVYEFEKTVYHDLKEIGQVYLQKGVYDLGTFHSESGYGDRMLPKGDRAYYSNSSVRSEYVRYYVTLYNGGNARMYLSTLYDELPKGFSYYRLDSYYLRTDKNCDDAIDTTANYRGTVTTSTNDKWTTFEETGVKLLRATVTENVIDSNTVEFNISGIHYDSMKGMYYLNKGEAISFVYLCYVGDRKATEDVATNSISMQYTDYMGAGVKIYDPGVTTGCVVESCTGVNDGDCRIVEGDVLESKVSMTRGEIVPGIIKSVESYTNTSGDELPYYNSAAYNAKVNWKLKLENTGYTALYNYTVTDTMQAPYTFVTGDNVALDIEIFNQSGDSLGKGTIPLPDTVREEGGANVTSQITPDGWRYSSGLSVHAEITVDNSSGVDTETLSLDLNSKLTAIPSQGYVEIRVSTNNNTPEMRNKVYINKVTLTPHEQYFEEISHGIPSTNEDGEFESISSYAAVNVVFGYATSSLKEVQEIAIPSNKANSQEGTRYITLNSDTSEFRYTLNVIAPEEKAMSNLVLIDSLPEIGDHSPYDAETYRGSEFKVSLTENPNFEVVITTSDGVATTLNADQYSIEYSKITDFVEADRKGVASENWSTECTPDTRSFRIIIDGDVAPMPENSTISASFNAKVDDENAKPGDIAWNSFGYYYTVNLGGVDIPMEAMPLEVGVRIPSLPTLRKKLFYQEGGNIFTSDKDETFKFLIHEGTALDSYEDLNNESFGERKATIAEVTVKAGESVSDKVLLENMKLWTVDSNGVWTEMEDMLYWVTDSQYTIYEIPHDEYKLGKLVGQKEKTYTFTFDPSVERTYVCENSPKKWEINLTKVDGLDNTLLLEGAGFALYSKDASEGVEVPDGLTDKLSQQIEVNGENWYFVKTGETDANGKLKFNDITSDVYYLYEYQTPKGYISKTQGQNIYYSDTEKGSISLTVENLYGVLLAKTGGMGVPQLMAVGLSLVIGSAVMLMLKKRKKSEQ